ncbi:MAG: dipeptidase [Chloroflexi bacterium]|nr:dipeptidase [Chloroflexota bacterium]
MSITPLEFARGNAEVYRNQLFELLRIPSISTMPEHNDDVRRAAEWLMANMKQLGMQTAELLPNDGHPAVYGEWLGAGPDAPTILVYGHYDVQPAVLADGWSNPPFEPVIRNGVIYARGASDDKGQMFTHLKALEAFLATEGHAPVNVKYLIEGEEEIGSPNLGSLLSTHKARLVADVCVISDTGMAAMDNPAITYALRGLAYMELHVTGPKRDLHSGLGGPVHNPALALSQIIAQLHNADGSVAVPGFYDDVLPLDADERAALREIELDAAAFIRETGIPAVWGEPGYTLIERQTARPTLEINGLLSGFTGAGSKTVLPAKAMAKISCRLVANQDPERIYQQVRAFVQQITPPTVRTELRYLNGGTPALVDRNLPAMQAAISAFERGWGAAPSFRRSGGTIPVVADFARELNIPSILMGFGLESDGAHGPDEHLSVEMFHRGIATSICFMEALAEKGR